MLLMVDDVSKMLKVSIPMAYKIMKKLNDELKEKGYYTISGRVEEKYLKERFRIE